MMLEPRILNIYCDASMTQIDGIPYGCPGAVAEQYIKEEDRSIIRQNSVLILSNATNNQAEIYAILIGVTLAINLKSEFDAVRIISDSRISVEGLRNWIYSWVQNSKNGVLMSSSGQPVANQQLFLYVFYSILQNLTRCSLCHIDGHRREYNANDVTKTLANFRKTNNIIVDEPTIRRYIRYNNLVDNLTRNILVNEMSKYPMVDINNYQLVNTIPTPQELEIYKRVTVTF